MIWLMFQRDPSESLIWTRLQKSERQKEGDQLGSDYNNVAWDDDGLTSVV